MKKNTKSLTECAMIAALYVVLTFLTNAFGLANGVIQCRLSEALSALALFTPSAVLGLFIGCFLANILTGAVVLDIILGSLATLIGTVFAYKFRKKPLLALLFPVISNTIIIPFVLKFGYGFSGGIWYFLVTVCIGEMLSCEVLGYGFYILLKKYDNLFN